MAVSPGPAFPAVTIIVKTVSRCANLDDASLQELRNALAATASKREAVTRTDFQGMETRVAHLESLAGLRSHYYLSLEE